MTKKLDPEIRALRAIERALALLDSTTQDRIARYVHNRWAKE
jgi:hypothetical protein